MDEVGDVARNLVGASLSLSFDVSPIRRGTAADTGRAEDTDFSVGDTVFVVAVRSTAELYEACRDYVLKGHDVLLLLPEGEVTGARADIPRDLISGVSVESIETFINQRVLLAADFHSREQSIALRRLLENYNRAILGEGLSIALTVEMPASLTY